MAILGADARGKGLPESEIPRRAGGVAAGERASVSVPTEAALAFHDPGAADGARRQPVNVAEERDDPRELREPFGIVAEPDRVGALD